MKINNLVFALVITILISLNSNVRLVEAQSRQVCDQAIRYLDFDDDEAAEAVVLNCQFVPGEADQVIVFDALHHIDPQVPWQESVDQQDDTWIFDHRADGQANLIVVFSRNDTGLLADLYDDRNGDGQVSYEINNGQVDITEGKYWTARVVAPDGWWLKDGKINFNLQILADGDVEAMFASSVYRSRLKTDGQVDFEIEVQDLDHDGQPDYDMRSQQIPWLQGSVLQGTQLMVNFYDDEAPITGGFNLWPYLDLSHEYTGGSRIVKGYNDSPPPIMFEPGTGRIEAIGELVASRGNEHNCFYYSTQRLESGQLNEANSENPFCFYDLAADQDGIPESETRAWYWLPNDPPFKNGTFPQPIEWIRYSWDQENNQIWRYAIGLVGRHLLDGRVAFPEFSIKTIPYEQFPSWVNGQSWDMAVLAEYTGKNYWTSEGVYEVSYLEDTQFQDYFTGVSLQAPSPAAEPVKDFRMEWAMDGGNRPWMYFSPVDRKLHLVAAQAGAWKIDDTHSILYNKLGEGDYINSWTSSVNGQSNKILVVKDGMIFYNDGSILILRVADVAPSLFRSLPPADNGEWLALGKLLEDNERNFAPDDFAGMLTQFEGPEIRISGAGVEDLRSIQSGFRFILDLKPGFTVTGPDWLSLNGKTPGKYAVEYTERFRVQPLTPPSLHLDFSIGNGTPTALMASGIQASLNNSGLQDARQVRVSLGTAGPGQEIAWTEPQTVTVLAGETTPVLFPWSPDSPGEWRLLAQARLLDPDTAPIKSVAIEQVVAVQPAEQTTFSQELSAFGLLQPWQVAGLVLALALAAALAVWALSRFHSETPGGRDQPLG